MRKLLLTLAVSLLTLAAMADCTVYYADGLTTPYAYAWTAGGEMSWPGQAMTSTSYTYGGNPVWQITFTTAYNNIIFSSNGNSQTSDLTLNCGQIYYKGAWTAYTPGDTLAGGGSSDDDPSYSTGNIVPSECEDIMLQGFYWDSYTDATYERTKWIDLIKDSAAIANFDLIWLPSPVRSSGGLGYHPTQWSSFDSGLGTKASLVNLVNALHRNGVKVIADIVVNHRGNKSSWCDFFPDNFGSKYGSTEQPDGNYQLTNNHIVSDDEAITGSHCTTTGNEDSGVESYEAARDLDHTNTYVRAAVKSYLAFLQGEIGFDGWRYDLVKGYSPSYLEEYNLASQPYLAVGEYFDGNVSTLKSFINNTNYHTMLFDFAMKYKAFNQGIASSSYGNLKASAGSKLCRESGYSKYAVTFIDNHDTFKRGDSNEFCDGTGSGNSLTNDTKKKKVLEANAYLLCMPGVPCVFWPHWVTFQEEITKMMEARRLAGIHSESEVSDETSGSNAYSATIRGHHGTIILRLGTNRDTTTPEGYGIYTAGERYTIYLKLDDGSFVDVENVPSAMPTYKVMIDGQIYIMRDGHKYTIMGQEVE